MPSLKTQVGYYLGLYCVSSARLAWFKVYRLWGQESGTIHHRFWAVRGSPTPNKLQGWVTVVCPQKGKGSAPLMSGGVTSPVESLPEINLLVGLLCAFGHLQLSGPQKIQKMKLHVVFSLRKGVTIKWKIVLADSPWYGTQRNKNRSIKRKISSRDNLYNYIQSKSTFLTVPEEDLELGQSRLLFIRSGQ